MLRLAIFLLFLFAFAMGLAWVADRPGLVTIEWAFFNKQIEMTLLNAIIAIAALVAIIMMVWWVISAVIHSPETFGRWRAGRRRDRGYEALSQGMIAIGAGNASVARRLTKESSRLLTNEPMVKMLDAQTSLLEGKRDDARKKFEAMLEKPETQLLGLRGLHIEAEKEANTEAAAHFAKEAYALSPDTPWAALGLLKAQGTAGDWSLALKTLESNRSTGIYSKEEYNRKRAVILTALAYQEEDTDPDKAKSHALAAHKLAPSLAPAAIIAARLCIRFSDLKKAARVLEANWKLEPHPEVAETYVNLRSGDSARDRLKRAETLASKKAHHAEGQFAIAHAAIDASDWKKARAAMEAVLRTTPSEKACLLMADIEEGENNDNGRVREWLSRAVTAPKDAAWTADGMVTEKWAPLSPVTGELDAFEWRVPLEQLGIADKSMDYSQLEPFEQKKDVAQEAKLIEVPTKETDSKTPETFSAAVGATAAAAATAKAAFAEDKKSSEKVDPAVSPIILENEVEDAEIIEETPAAMAQDIVEDESEALSDADLKDASDDGITLDDNETSTDETDEKPSKNTSPFKTADLDTNNDGVLDVRPDDPGLPEEEVKPKKRKNFFF